jgi:hypothetical protein
MPAFGAGVIAVDVCQVETEHSFLDYIAGGCELNFLVAGITSHAPIALKGI